MKQTYIYFSFTFMLLFATAFSLTGQQAPTYPAPEKLALSTDRTLYIAGETVYFSAFVLPAYRQQPPLSLVMYAEIITPEAKPIAGGKFPLKDYASNGSLHIPDDIITGHYYIRVYTKYMRNAGPESYAYASLRIVNPLRDEVMTANEKPDFNQTNNISEDATKAFLFKPDKKVYKTREAATISIEYKGFIATQIAGLSISVVPELSSAAPAVQLSDEMIEINHLQFYPETRGLSITGALKDKASGKPVPLTRVNLSLIGEGRDFMAIESDSSGRYFFSLPAYTGDRDLFLCTENTGELLPEILIDNDFCTVPIELPSPIFKLTTDERKLARQMAVNARVREVFKADTFLIKKQTTYENRPFYGQPTEILVIDQYVELPSLEEYFNELPTRVKVRKKQGKKYFKVLGDQSEMLVYDPLVLVDRVAVDDPRKVLSVSPQNVNRIEVINQPYTKGNITYGGIVSIISNEGDFAGIDLPESGVFLQYLFLTDTVAQVNQVVHSPAMPDARNTLYWNPKVEINSSGTTRFNFSTPDTPGRYTVVLSGITKQGEVFTQTLNFELIEGK